MQVTPLPQLKILHPDIIPDEDDPIGNYRHHLKNVHKMQLKSRLSQFAILHPDIIPDQNNPACEKTFAHKSDYHGHLEAIHKMTIVPKEKFANPHLTPDADDPNHYCCVCHKTMVPRDSYRSHLRGMRDIKLVPRFEILHPEIVPDDFNSEYYCGAC